jgi:hypothetical protein
MGHLLGRRVAAPPTVRAGLTEEDATALEAGVVLRTGRWLPRIGGLLAGSRGPAAAVTLGRTIVVHPDAALTARLLRHELEHVRQWTRRPLTFPLHYAWLYLRHGYRGNPYEAQARAAETRSPTNNPDA